MSAEQTRAEQAGELKQEIKHSKLRRVWDVGKFFYRTGLATAAAYTLAEMDNSFANHINHTHGHGDALPIIVSVGFFAGLVNFVRSYNDFGATTDTLHEAQLNLH